MLEIDIPGAPPLRLHYLVADYNGTLACDGLLLPCVADALHSLAEKLTIHVVTADTFGTVRAALQALPCEIIVLPPGRQDEAKLRHVEALGATRCVCIGNGRNDRAMLAAAALGIAVVQGEGAAAGALLAADVIAPDICVALALLRNPQRLVATLRV